jgi:haloalkane dehalogenase
VLVAHDASGLPAIDWALDNPGRVATLVLLNTYYHWTPALRRPRAIALYSTPVIRGAARAVVRRRPGLDRRLYAWQPAGSSTTPRCEPSLFHSCMSSSCPPGPRSGDLTTT